MNRRAKTLTVRLVESPAGPAPGAATSWRDTEWADAHRGGAAHTAPPSATRTRLTETAAPDAHRLDATGYPVDMNDTPRPVALVTGASRGLGFPLARELADRGYDLVICARNGDGLEPAGDELRWHMSGPGCTR